MQHTLKQLKIKPLLLVGVLLLSVFAGVLASPTRALAADALVKDKLDQFLYYRALSTCFDADKKGKISDTEATDMEKFFLYDGSDGATFNDTPKRTIGYVVNNDDGNIECGDDNVGKNNYEPWVAAAFESFGITTDPVGILCELGYSRQHKGPDCAGGSGYFNTPDDIKSRFATYAANHNIPTSPSKDMEYWLYLQTYEIGCKAKPLPGSSSGYATLANSDSTQKTIANSDKGAVIDYVKPETGELIKDVIFQSQESNGSNRATMVNPNGSNQNYTCKELASKISSKGSPSPNVLASNFSTTAKATPQTPDSSSSAGDATVDDTTCEGGGSPLSYIICPILNTVANAADKLFDLVIQPLLKTNPITFDSSSSVFAIWNSFRVLGNIVLVFALFAIIFSQALGINLDAYAVKKIMPRLFISAVLLNLSIYLVSVALDFTNILGEGLKALILTPLAGRRAGYKPGNFASLGMLTLVLGIFVAIAAYMKSKKGTGMVLAGNSSASNSNGPLLAGAFQMILLFVVIPAIIAIVMVIVTLVLRQGIIIFLVIIAPIAFALYALPNTEKYFKKWWDTLFKTLLVYPIIMMIFAVSEVLSAIIGGS